MLTGVAKQILWKEQFHFIFNEHNFRKVPSLFSLALSLVPLCTAKKSIKFFSNLPFLNQVAEKKSTNMEH